LVHGPGDGVFKELVTLDHDGLRSFHHLGELVKDSGHLLDGNELQLGDLLAQKLDFPVIQATQDITCSALSQAQQENGSFLSPAQSIRFMWPGHVLVAFSKAAQVPLLLSFS
jgi:hypothetical protein